MFRPENFLFDFFFRKKSASVEKLQEQALFKRIREAEGTAVHKKLGLSSIKTIRDYQKSIPVMHYSDLKEYWESEADGNEKQVNSVKAVAFALSTGTTGNPKLIPVPASRIREIKRNELSLIAQYLRSHNNSRILSKKILGVTGSGRIDKTSAGIPIGTISGLMACSAPEILRLRVLPDIKTINLTDWEKKVIAMTEQIRGKTIGCIAGISSSILDFIERTKTMLPPAEFTVFSKGLEIVFCTGVNYRPHRQRIYSLLEKEIDFLEYYAASEGIFGHQSEKDPDLMEFFPEFVFFEFIPFEEYLENRFQNRLCLHQLESGREYAVLVTAGSGMFSYVTGDVIECVDSSVPLFRISGRTVLTLNLAGEKVSINSIEKVIAALSDELKAQPADFFVTGQSNGGRLYYLWVIEQNEAWNRKFEKQICEKLESFLCECSNGYSLLRKSSLSHCQIIFTDREKFQRVFKNRAVDSGHCKIPRIIRDQKLVSEITGECKLPG